MTGEGGRRLARDAAGHQSRTFTLERMARGLGRMVRVFTDLEDVPPFDDIAAPDTGETTVWAVDWDTHATPRWQPVNIGAGGGTGGHATARATGDTTPDSWLDWSEASDPSWEPTLWAGGLAGDTVGGLVVSEPGFYDVAVVGVSEDAFTISAAATHGTAGGWQFASEVGSDLPFCRQDLAIVEHAGAGEGGASGSIQMALAAGHRVMVSITTAGYVEWSLSLELVARADIVDGSCGG